MPSHRQRHQGFQLVNLFHDEFQRVSTTQCLPGDKWVVNEQVTNLRLHRIESLLLKQQNNEKTDATFMENSTLTLENTGLHRFIGLFQTNSDVLNASMISKITSGIFCGFHALKSKTVAQPQHIPTQINPKRPNFEKMSLPAALLKLEKRKCESKIFSYNPFTAY